MGGPWNELLPTSVEVYGTDYEIRSDYRAILDICSALDDPELEQQDKAAVALDIFYLSIEEMPPECYQEALDKCFWFIRGGNDETARKAPKLMDWKQDFSLIVAPINRVTGKEIRSLDYMHWWTFLAAYYEIGDCLFAQVVRIRELKSRGKTLDKADREFYNKNRDIIDLRTTYTGAEKETLGAWGV